MNDINIMRSNMTAHVKHYMKVNDIQFAEVASRLDMGKSTAWRVCFDQVTNPQLKTLIKIADTLGLTLAQLLETNPNEEI